MDGQRKLGKLINLIAAVHQAGSKTHFDWKLLETAIRIYGFFRVVRLTIPTFEGREREGDQLIEAVADSGADLVNTMDGAVRETDGASSARCGAIPVVGKFVDAVNDVCQGTAQFANAGVIRSRRSLKIGHANGGDGGGE